MDYIITQSDLFQRERINKQKQTKKLNTIKGLYSLPLTPQFCRPLEQQT
jgi:hypothetical protein